jgi:RimJ/RimL family protein N-acetyltransferase
MMKGKIISLRLMRESDLETVYNHHLDIESRGEFFPVGVLAEPVYRQRFASTGFWEREEGTLLIVNSADKILGHIEFFRTVPYLDEIELSYQIYSGEHTGKGVATEAVNLMTKYLFDYKKFNRIRLIIHPGNAASIKIAKKCGYKHEGTARGAWFHKGKNQDIEVFAMLRDELKRTLEI